MQCPKCKRNILKAQKISGSNIELDFCPNCKGLWFDKDELTILLGKHAPQNFKIPDYATSNSKEKCPKCDEALYEFCYPNTMILVDACKSCSGIWLDNLEWKEIKQARNPDNQMTCPRCSRQQIKSDVCQHCGIIISKYSGSRETANSHKENESPIELDPEASFDQANYQKALKSSNIFKQLAFVQHELKDLPGIDKKPSGGVAGFFARVGYAFSLAFKEKEIFVFALLQWAAIALAYLLWVQMLDWIPEEVWRSAENSDSASVADYILLAWSVVCIGVAAFPIGILTGCMGTAHFLHRQGQESTIAKCLNLVLPRTWPLWVFHWVDGLITVRQITERLPRKNDNRTAAEKALGEALYYAWKMGVAGVLPSILTGNSLVRSGKNSVFFVKNNFLEVAKLRAGYSFLCWVVGIGAYIGTIILFIVVDILPEGDEVYSHIFIIYLWVAIPVLIALSVVMLILRPIYVIAICDLYSDYLEQQGKPVSLTEDVPKSMSAFIAFLVICIIVAAVFLFRDEMGISSMLATPHSSPAE